MPIATHDASFHVSTRIVSAPFGTPVSTSLIRTVREVDFNAGSAGIAGLEELLDQESSTVVSIVSKKGAA